MRGHPGGGQPEPDPLSAGGKLDPAITAVIAAGVKGLVYATVGVGDLPRKEDVNSRNGTGDFPVLLVGQHSGATVLADAEGGESADLTLQAKLGTATDYDVWGVLPGADTSRRVFVGTPTSSFVPSASERGGGVAIMLGLEALRLAAALAGPRHWSSWPPPATKSASRRAGADLGDR